MPVKQIKSRTDTTTTIPSQKLEDAVNFIVKKQTECFQTNVSHSEVVYGQVYDKNGTWCPKVFDGLTCWEKTPPESVAVQRCPDYFTGFDSRLLVYKECGKNGAWKGLPNKIETRSWTNYTSCVDLEDLGFRHKINTVYEIGYTISLITLLLSLVIFVYFRSLRCSRTRVHMHLFTSYAISNLLWIMWHEFVINDVDVVLDNPIWCQVLHVLATYFMLTGYFWMFVEGLHLHLALVVVFMNDVLTIKWYKAIGWGMSFLVIVVYSIVRYLYGDTERCWMENSDTFWIISAPVAITLLSSFVFLVNVVRVLFTKIPAPHQADARDSGLKVARAALLLVPLFGLHYLLIPLRPSRGSACERAYDVISAVLTSLQGFCVSVLFCFTNHEVTTAAKAQWARVFYRRHNEAFPMTGITRGESVNTRENMA